MRRRGKKKGFTLVELMVVLTIMGITVGLAMPTMSASLADRRVWMAARDIVRMYRQSRYSSLAYGRAHGVSFDADYLTLEWKFRMWRGTYTGCIYNTWGTRVLGIGTDYIAQASESDYDPDGSNEDAIRVEGWNRYFMCYEGGASNRLYKNEIFSATWGNQGRGGIAFSVGRVVKGEPKGVIRKIFVPSGSGMPRMLR